MWVPRVTEPERVTRLAFALLALFAGCKDNVRELQLELVLPADSRCRPVTGEAPNQLEIHALGDFPAEASTLAFLTPNTGRVAIDRFPADTEMFWMRADVVRVDALAWFGTAFAMPDEVGAVHALLLPAQQGCALSTTLSASEGSAALALPDGGFALVGGSVPGGSSGTDTFRIFRRDASEIPAPPLRDPRFGATVTPVGELLVIAGGGRARTGSGSQTAWVRDLVGARVGEPIVLPVPLRDHAAIAVDNEVLLVGGRENSGVASLLDEVVAIDPVTRTVRELPALELPRMSPQLFALDDGAIVLAGGNGVTDISLFDRASESFVAGAELPLESWAANLQWATLPGGRALGLPESNSAGRGALLEHHAGVLTLTVITVPAALQTIGEVTTAALGDGRVLVAGTTSAEVPVALAYDPIRDTIDLWSVPMAPRHVFSSHHGALVALGSEGVALIAANEAGGRGEPPTETFPRHFALDAPGHWIEDDELLVAQVTGARATFVGGSDALHAGLRFRDVAISARSSAPLAVRFWNAAGALEARVEDGRLSVGACGIEWSANRLFTVRYGSGSIRLEQEDRARECPVTPPDDQPVLVGIEADTDAVVRELAIERLRAD